MAGFLEEVVGDEVFGANNILEDGMGRTWSRVKLAKG